jgi:hypothetical protein
MRKKTFLLASLIFLIISIPAISSGREKLVEIKIVNHAPPEKINRYYICNRTPLQPNPLIRLPVGHIEPGGWLLSQLQLVRDGFIGHLPEISKFLEEDSGWLTLKGCGWEEMPYWLKGYGDLAYLLKEPDMISVSQKWIEAILRSRESDGYFGPVQNRMSNDLWPNMVALFCLQSYHDFSKDKHILDFMSKYFRYELNIPEEKFLPGSWQKLRGSENLESIYWLYNRTGEKWLLDLGHKIFRRTADWTSPILTPDLKALHYLTAADLISCDSSGEQDFQNSRTLLFFDHWKYRCCQHNVAIGWSYLAEHLWLATSDEGVSAVIYRPATVEVGVGKRGQKVRIVEDTECPFDEKIMFTVYPEVSVDFPSYLRIPGWAEQAYVTVNEEKPARINSPGRFSVLHRNWQNGDQVVLIFDEPIKIKFWEGTGRAVSVAHSPLWYFLEIKEGWTRYAGTDQWPAYEDLPASPWNYALVLNPENPSKNVRVVAKKSLSYQPFSLEVARIVLEARVRRLPDWEPEGKMVGKVLVSPVLSKQPEETIRLVAMGCGRLRITCFPWTKEKPCGGRG